MTKKSFVLYQEYENHLELLTFEQKGRLLDAIFGYKKNQDPELEPIVKMAFSFIKADLERANKKYNSVVERNKLNGSKGGRPKEPKKPTGFFGNPEKPKKPDNDNDNDNDNDIIINNNKEDQFNEFWNLYNYKKSKPKALAAYKKALKIESHDNILKGVKSYILSRGDDKQFWKHPTTWLNAQAWLDEYKSNTPTTGTYEKKITPQESFAIALAGKKTELARRLGINPIRLSDEQINALKIDIKKQQLINLN